MLNTQLVRDRFGQYYKINTSRDKPAPKSLKAEYFRNDNQATRFVENLSVSVGHWNSILITSCLSNKPSKNQFELNSRIVQLLKKGKIQVYKIEIPSYAEHPPEKRTVLDNRKNKHTFASSTILLTTSPKEVFTFNNKKEAHKYLKQISPDKTELKDITKALDLPRAQTDEDPEVIKDKIATALATGKIIVIVDRYTTPPKPEEYVTESLNEIGNRKADLGPHETIDTPKHWFEFQFTNELDEPYVNESFTIKLSDNATVKSTSNSNSTFRKDQLPVGICSIQFDNFYDQIETWLEERNK